MRDQRVELADGDLSSQCHSESAVADEESHTTQPYTDRNCRYQSFLRDSPCPPCLCGETLNKCSQIAMWESRAHQAHFCSFFGSLTRFFLRRSRSRTLVHQELPGRWRYPSQRLSTSTCTNQWRSGVVSSSLLNSLLNPADSLYCLGGWI